MKMVESDLTEKEKAFIMSGTDQAPSDPPFRISTKESAKGFRYYEWTVRGETFDEIKVRNEEVRKYVDTMRMSDWKQIEKLVDMVSKKRDGE